MQDVEWAGGGGDKTIKLYNLDSSDDETRMRVVEPRRNV